MRVGVLPGDQALDLATHQALVPVGIGKKLLQRPRRRAGRQRDRLDAFARQIGQLPLQVSLKMRYRLGAAEAVIEMNQIAIQRRGEPRNGCGIHAKTPCGNRPSIGESAICWKKLSH